MNPVALPCAYLKDPDMTNPTHQAARSRLLEVSPYGVDNGQKIGRDPRTISADEAAEADLSPDLAKAAIRAKCLDLLRPMISPL